MRTKAKPTGRGSTALVRSCDLVNDALRLVVTECWKQKSAIIASAAIVERTRIVVPDVSKMVTTAVVGLADCNRTSDVPP